MLKSFSTTLLAFALAAPLPGFAQQDDAARQKELDAARADLQRAAKRVAELSKDAGRVGSPVEIDHLIVRRPRLGILLSGDDAAGVRITGVTPDSGAAKAGLKAGDRLLRVDGETVNGSTGDGRVAHARKLLADLQAETPVRVTYQRDGKTYDASVTPTQVSPRVAFAGQGPGTFFFRTGESGMPWIDGAPMPMGEIATVIAPEVQRELRQLGRLGDCKGEDCRLPALAEAFRWSNLNLATVDASLGRYFGTENGVLVLSVGEELAGLQAGDVIRKVDGKPVTTPRDVTQALRDKPEDAKVAVEYLRDRQTRTSTVTVPKAAAFRFPSTSRVVVKPRATEAAGKAPTVVERRRVMIVDQDGKVQTFEDDDSDAPLPPPPPAPPVPASGKGGTLL
ncbi:PDZ domain-containing protein [Pseudoxanthomonas sp. F11]|uniref:PDZ domain-containing protein n=1 Tax=Pseudoxanthomonas sp. F11 TaxID=3126308 RepID=UPI00300D6250